MPDVPKRTTLELSDEQIRRAEKATLDREFNRETMNYRGQHGRTAELQNSETFRSIKAAIGFEQMSGVDCSHVYRDRKPTKGAVNVCSIENPRHRLPIEVNEPPETVFVLMLVQDRKVTFLGTTTAAEGRKSKNCKRETYRTTSDYVYPCYLKDWRSNS